jgi:hypothetical protein
MYLVYTTNWGHKRNTKIKKGKINKHGIKNV